LCNATRLDSCPYLIIKPGRRCYSIFLGSTQKVRFQAGYFLGYFRETAHGAGYLL
jgi:hypothetical protein